VLTPRSLNMPQAAILGIHAIKEKPWVVDGKIEIRPIMVVALTYDHRLLDGREAVTMLGTYRYPAKWTSLTLLQCESRSTSRTRRGCCLSPRHERKSDECICSL
jgi:hypothetical protein